RIAQAGAVPVLVDAAAELPPKGNLRRFIEEGADLVAFSGGKSIGGPSASGILCGRKQLIASALLQQLDLDYVSEDWRPPPQLIDPGALPGGARFAIVPDALLHSLSPLKGLRVQRVKDCGHGDLPLLEVRVLQEPGAPTAL